MDVSFFVVEESRSGAVTPAVQSLSLMVGHGGDAAMVHQPARRSLLRSRCRSLAADDLAEVRRAVERLESSVVAERKKVGPKCRQSTRIVLRGDDLLETFAYCDTTPPAAIVRFVEEISKPLGRRFGEEVAEGLAATAPAWASPVPAATPGR